MNEKIAIDTNILIYVLDLTDIRKKELSEKIIDNLPIISTHNISELANVCLRKFKFDKIITFEIINRLLRKCVLSNCTTETYFLANEIMKKYNLQLFDAIIISSAIESNCTTLYSEDMHHGLLIEGRLTIVNPFL